MKVLVSVKRVVDYNVKVRVKSDGTGVDAWKVKVRKSLKEKGYGRGLIETHLKTIATHSAFIEKQTFLY